MIYLSAREQDSHLDRITARFRGKIPVQLAGDVGAARFAQPAPPQLNLVTA